MDGQQSVDPVFAIEKRLGYSFQDRCFLLTALTHSSYAHEKRIPAAENNERLEFLGDALLGAAISEILYHRYSHISEGMLSLFRQQLVCEATLARIARRLGIVEGLRLGNGEERQGGREKRSILADAAEAVIAAVYLDSGENGMERIREILSTLFDEEFDRLSAGDSKSLLQQVVEQDGNERLDYAVVSVEGPAHAPLYTVHALLNSNVIGKGRGTSKQEAEQMAAKEALSLFGGDRGHI